MGFEPTTLRDLVGCYFNDPWKIEDLTTSKNFCDKLLQNISCIIIVNKIFGVRCTLKFGKFPSQYFYKMYSYKNKRNFVSKNSEFSFLFHRKKHLAHNADLTTVSPWEMFCNSITDFVHLSFRVRRIAVHMTLMLGNQFAP